MVSCGFNGHILADFNPVSIAVTVHSGIDFPYTLPNKTMHHEDAVLSTAQYMGILLSMGYFLQAGGLRTRFREGIELPDTKKNINKCREYG